MNVLPNAGVLTARTGGWRERIDLELVDLTDTRGAIVTQVPIIDGWLQIDATVTHVPSAPEERAFFAELAALRAARPSDAWFFLHKPPGLRLRFKLGAARDRDIDTILAHALQWRAAWLGELAVGSFFAQPQLFAPPHRECVDAILTTAANELLDVVSAGRPPASLQAWSDFACAFVEHFTGDAWFAWEALSRFARLRSARLRSGAPQPETLTGPWHDPRGMLAHLHAHSALLDAPGFGAGTALLHVLNYIFNMWAVDAPAQRAIVDRARSLAAPELVRR